MNEDPAYKKAILSGLDPDEEAIEAESEEGEDSEVELVGETKQAQKVSRRFLVFTVACTNRAHVSR